MQILVSMLPARSCLNLVYSCLREFQFLWSKIDKWTRSNEISDVLNVQIPSFVFKSFEKWYLLFSGLSCMLPHIHWFGSLTGWISYHLLSREVLASATLQGKASLTGVNKYLQASAFKSHSHHNSGVIYCYLPYVACFLYRLPVLYITRIAGGRYLRLLQSTVLYMDVVKADLSVLSRPRGCSQRW